MTGTVKTEQPEVEMISALRPATFENAEEWYDYASEEHFWFQWRFAAMLRFLQDLEVPLDRPARVLDVGCGTGVLRSQLEAVTPWVVDGADLNLGALRAAPPGRGATRYTSSMRSFDISNPEACFW